MPRVPFRLHFFGIRFVLCSVLVAAALAGEPWAPGPWPVLRHYDAEHLLRVALPVGGIGTGTVSVGGRGDLRDWELMNQPARGFSGIEKPPGNDAPFFALYVRAAGHSETRALLGPLDSTEYEAADGRPVNHHGLPRFQNASFAAAYPFGQVSLSDPQLPVAVKLRVFNPLVPGDAEASGLPVAVLAYEVTNLTDSVVEASVCGSMRNFIGMNQVSPKADWAGKFLLTGAKRNTNQFRQESGLQGIAFGTAGVDPTDPGWGTMALVTEATTGVSVRTDSGQKAWKRAIQDWWDDFSADGELTDADRSKDDDPFASLAVKQPIPARATRTFTFFLTWHFPNRRAWVPDHPAELGADRVGNYYCTRFADAWDAAVKIVPRLPQLEASTRLFVQSVCDSDYPSELKEAALFNLATLRSPTVFRIESGEMMAWEGVMETTGSCFGSCTHVWNYEAATPFLFADLARTMREVEFGAATADDGKMSFRVSLPLARARDYNRAAADGQMGTVVKFYREWQLSGDREFLLRFWPKIRSALAYAWVPGGWDADQDGVMEGAQHNTMDVDYHGPNPQMQFWYFAALEAGARMARAVGDTAFAAQCAAVRAKGSAWTEQRLFNGEYYEQIITDPATHAFVDWDRPGAPAVPGFQLGRGCLVDQLVGQTMAKLCGLGDMAEPAHVRTTLRSIMRFNFRDSFAGYFNNMRSFVLGDEAGLVMAAWPRGRLKVPFPYFNEAMTGFEYTAAVGLIQEGMEDDARKVVGAIRARFDGRKRNPFDEPECGFHYGRALTSWNTLLAWSGFGYSAVDRTMRFSPRVGTYFWSNGRAWGTVELKPRSVRLNVLRGSLGLSRVIVGDQEARVSAAAVAEGNTLELALAPLIP